MQVVRNANTCNGVCVAELISSTVGVSW
jgi:hypothetical protein